MGSYYLGVIYAGVVFKETTIMARIMEVVNDLEAQEGHSL